jgi:hypothetical protein
VVERRLVYPESSNADRRWGWLSGAAALAAVILIVITAGATRPYYPVWVAFVPFVLVFPIQFRTIFSGIRRRRGDEEATSGEPLVQVLLATVGRRNLLALAVLYLCAFVLVAFSVPRLWLGQPERHGAHYYQDSHGHLTEVSKRTYHSAEIAVQRFFLGGAVVFLTANAVANLRAAKRSKLRRVAEPRHR